jgi:magnesium chelatase family protein
LPQEVLLAHADKHQGENSELVSARVKRARAYQLARQGKPNAMLAVSELDDICIVENEAQQLLNRVMERFQFSARVYHRLLKLARTIADIEQSQVISLKHISEAVQYRSLDRLKSNS